MKPMTHRVFSLLVMGALFIGACSTPTPVEPTPDAAAIATAAVQTAEARFTQQALVELATRIAALPTSTVTPQPQDLLPTPTSSVGANPSYDYTPGCVYATYVADVTIPDGMLILPGAVFTKTWRIKNSGSCKWDANFGMVQVGGDKMSEQIWFPLTRVVYPGQEVDVSVTLTAPTANGKYTSQWRLALPGGGSAGVGQNDVNLTVSIEVSNKPKDAFAVTNVVYGPIVRDPQKGCDARGARYTFSATISVNGPGELIYQWDREPFDGVFEGGKLKFNGAESKQVFFTWTMTRDHPQNWERWVALRVTYEGADIQYDRIRFVYTCD
ncbi:MAG: hypothetical protein DDG60_12560 [Anaerolineae bacterium]|nr:MAG: hypothetical protein DDG60_12560 [Anaerolineae bacterium]